MLWEIFGFEPSLPIPIIMSHASADRNFLQFKEMTTNMNTYVPKDEIFLQMFFALKSIST